MGAADRARRPRSQLGGALCRCSLGPMGLGSAMTLCLKEGYRSHVQKPTEIPDGPHWVILSFESVSVSSGWEKAGECGASETVTRYHIFGDEQSWRRATLELHEKNLHKTYGPRDEFVALRASGKAAVKMSLSVSEVPL